MPVLPTAEITDSHRRRALVLLFMVSLFNYGDRNMIGILVPAIKADLGLSDTEIGFITGLAFSLFYALMGIPIARLADRFSRRGIVSIALAVWSAMTCACGLAQNFVQLALARVLVGVGEAGATPPSHAIIADLFPKARRAFALSVYAFGSPMGVIIAYLAGAWLTQEYGWRVTLFAFGVPGIAVAVLIYRALPEPPRGASELNAGDAPITSASLKEALRTLLAKPAFRQNAIGSGLFAFLWFGLLSWAPSFFTRTHAMPLAEVGAWLSLALGLSQLLGVWLGGVLGDKLGARDVRWYPWLCALSMVGSAPFYLVVFLSPTPMLALVALFCAVTISIMQSGPQHWITQAVAGPRMRATATATYLLIVNLISGFGAQIVGVLSDALNPAYGVNSLGMALLGVAIVLSLWSALHFWRIGRTLAADIAAADVAKV
ncbi:MAG: MFS transporter [Rhodospirillaceae bacterium]|nr:MFS transporter [Rhodospirillaceae bacterium]